MERGGVRVGCAGAAAAGLEVDLGDDVEAADFVGRDWIGRYWIGRDWAGAAFLAFFGMGRVYV
jgi:hypothetical protein